MRQILEQLFDEHTLLKAGFWKKIKIAIADDYKIFRDGLKVGLAVDENLQVISEINLDEDDKMEEEKMESKNSNIDLEKKEKIKTVLISLLQDENSWIFLPEQVIVYYYSNKRKAFMPGVMELFPHETPGVKQCNFRELSFIQKNKINFFFVKNLLLILGVV